MGRGLRAVSQVWRAASHSNSDAEAPVGDKVVLDFNRADRPTCAFSTYSLCPLPPRQNRLPLRVQAGEKRPPRH